MGGRRHPSAAARGPGRCAALALAGALAGACAAPPPVPPEAATFTVDASEAPDLEAWGEGAARLCRAWYAPICRELWSDGFVPYASVEIVLRAELEVPAATAGRTIFVSAPHVRVATGDEGMLVHELVHVVQRYPANPGMDWLTEGIADHVRFYEYEPETPRPALDPRRASYRDGYRTAAAFLAWLRATRDPESVARLNACMRRGGCTPQAFDALFGAGLDELWGAFAAAGAPVDPPAPAPAAGAAAAEGIR